MESINLPNVPEIVKTVSDRILVMPEPLKGLSPSVEMTQEALQSLIEAVTFKEQMQTGSTSRGVVVVSCTKAEERGIYKGSIVAFPFGIGVYPSVNIDKHLLCIMRDTDVMVVLPDLTELEVMKWNSDQALFIQQIWKEDTKPAPTRGKFNLN